MASQLPTAVPVCPLALPHTQNGGCVSSQLQQESQGLTVVGHLWARVHLEADSIMDPWVGQTCP